MFEPLQVFRRGDEGDVHRLAEGSLTEFGKADAIAGSGELLEVAENLSGIGQLEIVAWGEAEVFLRCGNGRMDPCSGSQRNRGGQEDRPERSEPPGDSHHGKCNDSS